MALIAEYESRVKVLLSQWYDILSNENCDTVVLSSFIVKCVLLNEPVSHRKLFDSIIQKYTTTVDSVFNNIAQSIEETLATKSLGAPNENIIRERFHYILMDLYNEYTNPKDAERAQNHQKMIDILENEDLNGCLERRAHELNSAQNHSDIKFIGAEREEFVVTSPMKLAISSANNSDRHGAAKLEGSKVLNMAINITPSQKALPGQISPVPPISVRICLLDEPMVRLECFSDLTGSFTREYSVITKGICKELLCLGDSGKLYSNSKDIFRFHKYGLAFVGIVKSLKGESEYILSPARAWDDIMSFTMNRGLLIDITSVGPSRSGFSSSSSVMSALLSALYSCSGQGHLIPQLEDLVLLAENNLGFRSGWNDTYALRAGVHHYITERTTELPSPIHKADDLRQLDIKKFKSRLLVIHTGIQRQATHRMNRRHEVYLSKDPVLYPVLLDSLQIHDKMVASMNRNDYDELGRLMTKYTQLRATFDPDALSHPLRRFFQVLEEKGVIVGGMLAGAMGGGIAQVMLTEFAVTDPRCVRDALEIIRQLSFDGESMPFDNSLFGTIDFDINCDGVCLTRTQQ